MVPKGRFELPRPRGALRPERSASASSATSARHGGRYWARTSDLLRVKQALVPTELTAHTSALSVYRWRRERVNRERGFGQLRRPARSGLAQERKRVQRSQEIADSLCLRDAIEVHPFAHEEELDADKGAGVVVVHVAASV